MQIESKDLKAFLIKLKADNVALLDRTKNKQVVSAIDARIAVIVAMLLWLDKSEKEGELKMDDLKLGELVTWEPKQKSGIDSLIINDAKALKKNFQAVKISIKEVNWNTFTNRVYKLREANKIDTHIVPRKDKDGVPHLVYLDNPHPKRGGKD